MPYWKELYNQEYSTKINTLMSSDDVNTFISRFLAPGKFSDIVSARQPYLSGNCYWFAVILKERFKDYLPKIWYDTLNNHFYTEICGILYDANGAFLPDKNLTIDEYNSFYIWEDYKKIDRTHAKRIERDCINFTYEED